MINVADLQTEVKAGAVFGAVALFLSFSIGLLAGNGIADVMVRSLILTIMFALLGYGVTSVVRKFVPEVMEIRPLPAEKTEAPAVPQGEERMEQVKTEEVPNVEEPADTAETPGTGSGFVPFKESDFAKVDANLNIEQGKLGKHIIVNEKKMKYEPKIMAQAIRTMISRDKE